MYLIVKQMRAKSHGRRCLHVTIDPYTTATINASVRLIMFERTWKMQRGKFSYIVNKVSGFRQANVSAVERTFREDKLSLWAEKPVKL